MTRFRSYTVREGDTLSLISRRELGDAGLWERLHHLNRDLLACEQRSRGVAVDPYVEADLIFPGTVLRIPL